MNISPSRKIVPGLCPSCESPGALGDACSEKVCARQGTCFIPDAMARKALALGPGQREPLIGQFIGDFLIVGRLGQGGFGKVLLGLQRSLYKLQAAVKLLEFNGGDERTTLKVAEKFETEASSLAVLQSPHIVRLLQYGAFHGRPYMAMEFIPGSRTLQTEINRMALGHEALASEVIRRIIEQVLFGLEASHQQGIIHRDIKPENIMLQDVVGDPWFVKLVDFGLAKLVEESRETSLVLGTIHYMAPEQVEAKNLGPWTDLYAVGVVAYELLIGHRPFVGKETQAILREKLNPAFDPIARCAHLDLPDVVVTFLRKAMHRFPDKRYRSTSEFRAAWAQVFEIIAGATHMFSMDLSGLVDSSDVSELKRMESALVRQRQELESQRRALDEDRRQLESERVRASGMVQSESNRAATSDALSSPAAVESWAMGSTQALSKQAQGTDESIADIQTAAVSPSVVLSATAPKRVSSVSSSMDTHAIISNDQDADLDGPPSKRRRLVWLALGALPVAGILAAVSLRGGAPPAASTAGSVASVEPTLERSAMEPERPKLPSAAGNARPTNSALPPVPAPPAEPAAAGIPSGANPPDVAVSPPKPRVLEKGAATSVIVNSDPSGVKVFVDGRLVGKTPYTLATTVGATHRIEAETSPNRRTSQQVAVSEALEPESVLLKAAVSAVPKPVARPTPAAKPPAAVQPQVTAKPATMAKPAAEPTPPAEPDPAAVTKPAPRPPAVKPAEAIPDF